MTLNDGSTTLTTSSGLGLTPTELQTAWDDAFENGVNFDHKPTDKDMLLVRLQAVADAQDTKTLKAVGERVKAIWNQEENRATDMAFLIDNLQQGKLP